MTQALIHSLGEGLFGLDKEGRFTFINPEAEKILGWEGGELVGKKIHETIHCQSEDNFQDNPEECPILNVIKTKTSYREREDVFFRKDRKKVPVSYIATPIVLQGTLVGVNVAFRDITERKKVEAELQASGDRLEGILDTASDAIISINEKQQIILFNSQAEAIFGYQAQEVTGKPLDLLLPDRVREIHKAHVAKFAAEDVSRRLMSERGRILLGRRKNGEEFPVEISISKLKIQNQWIFTAIVRDITERKSREDELRKLFQAVEQSPSIVLITNLKGDIEYVNPKFTQVTGYGREEAIGKNPRILKSDKKSPEEYQQLWDTLLAGKEWRGELENQKKNGELYWEDSCISPVKDREGNITHFLKVGEDITERKLLEEEFRQSQKLEAFGRLAGGIAHDFNNLLMVIQGYTDLRERELASDDPTRKDFEEIKKAADRAVKLTGQLLAFSRRQMIAPKILNLNELILNLDKMLRRVIGEDIELVLLMAPDCGLVKIDPTQLEQILMNLTVNSRDAMPQGGKITVETMNVMLDGYYLRSHPKVISGKYVMLSVSDSGVGMPEEIKKHIFEPFFTTKEKGKGTGLGLATCYGIVKQNNGYIWVYSEPNQGTAFKIYFPLVIGETATSLDKPPEVDLISLQGTETVLLVEDEPAVRHLSGQFLREQGYTVLEAANGEEALRINEENPNKKVDLLFTDVVMPRMGGKELTERLKAICPDIKVLLTSGYTDDTIISYELVDLNVEFLPKPYTRELMLTKIRQMLDKK